MNKYRFAPLLAACALYMLLTPQATGAAGQDDALGKEKDTVVWGEMPAGARTAYIGIHGGTVPVSLLTAGDGSPMIAQVGLTGSDFLNFLRSKGRLEEELTLSDAPVPVTDASEELPTPKIQPSMTEEVLSTTSEQESVALPADNATLSGTMPVFPSENATESAEMAPASPADNATQPVAMPPVLPAKSNTLALAGSPDGDIPVIYATGHAFERMSLIPKNWAPFGLTEKALSVEGEVKILSTPKKQPRSQKRRR